MYSNTHSHTHTHTHTLFRYKALIMANTPPASHSCWGWSPYPPPPPYLHPFLPSPSYPPTHTHKPPVLLVGLLLRSPGDRGVFSLDEEEWRFRRGEKRKLKKEEGWRKGGVRGRGVAGGERHKVRSRCANEVAW